MKRRFVQINGELVEVGEDYIPEPRAEFHVMGDIQPYRSMVDGTLITSRSRHREHLRDHGVVEVGNDPLVMNPQYRGLQSPPGLKDKIVRAYQQQMEKRRSHGSRH